VNPRPFASILNDSTCSRSSARLSLCLQVFIFAVTLGYGFYHLLAEAFFIGLWALFTAVISAFAVRSVYRKEFDIKILLSLFVAESICLLLTSYFFGLRGLVLVFPMMAAVFYVFEYRFALLTSLLFAGACLFAATFKLELAMIARMALAQILSASFLASFSYLVLKQYRDLETKGDRDHLTGMMNRRGFERWLQRELPKSSEANSPMSLLLFSIDGFKNVNDMYGHSAGDELLRAFSNRIMSTLRSRHLVGENESLNSFARLSGDEFALSLSGVDSDEGLHALTARIIDYVSEPFNISGRDVRVSISAGLSTARTAGYQYSVLLSQAGYAMYEAKKTGKNGFQIYDEQIADKKAAVLNIEKLLRTALKNDGFELVFQPIYNALDGRMKGAEALLRCSQASAQGVYPDTFIPVAEEVGLIREIDLWVIENVFRRISALPEGHDFRRLVYSINISALELNNAMFPIKLKELLSRYDVDVKKIQLEITETSLIALNEKCMGILKRISDLGVLLALDDFGMGYTAFNQLRSYPVDTLKIDRSFIMDLDINAEKAMAMVKIILSLADLYKLKVTAEGVETARQLHFLKAVGCDYIQGELYSFPLIWPEFCSLSMEAIIPCKVTPIKGRL